MKVRKLLLLLLVVILIFASTYLVVFGVSFGVKEFTPLRAIKQDVYKRQGYRNFAEILQRSRNHPGLPEAS